MSVCGNTSSQYLMLNKERQRQSSINPDGIVRIYIQERISKLIERQYLLGEDGRCCVGARPKWFGNRRTNRRKGGEN